MVHKLTVQLKKIIQYISLTIFTETCRNAGKVEYLSDPPPNSFKSCMILSTNTWGEVQPHTGGSSTKKMTFPARERSDQVR